MRIHFLVILILFITGQAIAQDTIIPLWPDEIPCANDHEIEIINRDIGRVISKVHSPDIAVYHPADPNGTAILICPGGGYQVLAYDWEGVEFAEWLINLGITAIVLKNRLPAWEHETCRETVALADAKKALRLIRMHAEEWSINTSKIGVMGFSAGGHLASSLSTHLDDDMIDDPSPVEKISSRPDFSILVYPVISMNSDVTHAGSKANLIGHQPTKESEDYYSNELRVTKNTPPALLIHASDDQAVPVQNSILYYERLLRHDVPASLMIYETGGHGFSFARGKGAVSKWTEVCKDWLAEKGLLLQN